MWLVACSATSDEEFSAKGGSAGSGGGSAGTGGGVLDASGGGSSIDDENCGEATYSALRVPANVLMLLDKSGSMTSCPDGSDSCSQDKWDGARQAISASLSSAPPELGVGLVFFPAGEYPHYFQCQNCLTTAMQNNGNVSAQCQPIIEDCGCLDVSSTPEVPVDKLATTLPKIQSELSSASPDGNTPTFHALSAAYDVMRNLPAEGDKYVLLMTDGDPTTHQPREEIPGPITIVIPESFHLCREAPDILAVAHEAATGTPPVKTFVVGSPGVENFGFMSEIAVAGGTSRTPTCDSSEGCNNADNCCHYQIGGSNFAADLEALLTEIAGQLATCVFAIPSGDENVNPDLVNVRYQIPGSEEEDLLRDPAHEDGWDYTDDSKTKVEIFGPACDAIKANTESEVTILLGCKTKVK